MSSSPTQKRPRTADPLAAELTLEERRALEGLLGGGATLVRPAVAQRLVALGLVERLLGSFALTRTGRDFVLRQRGWTAS